MPKNKNKTNNPVSEPDDHPSGTAVAPSSTNTVLLVIIIILLLLIITGVLGWMGWRYFKNKKENLVKQFEQSVQQQNRNVPQEAARDYQEKTVPDSQNYLVYENKEFGFRLKFTPAWANYRAEPQTLGGDFEVSRDCFFLPTEYKEYTGELFEYTSPFCISAYVAYSWDETQETNGYSAIAPMGEVVGRNSRYVFVYSHFNGDMPPDVPQQAILDMQKIAEKIEVFEPSSAGTGISGPTSEAGIEYDNSSFQSPTPGSRPVVDPDFQMTGVYYWNCKHRYTLTYPTAWSNNGMTFDSNVVILKGSQSQIRIEAVPIAVAETLQGFAQKRAAKIEGNQVWVESIDWNGEATVFQVTYRNPDSMVLYWLAGDYGMELKAFGSGYNGEYDNIQKTIATLDPNITIPQCSASLSKTSEYKTPKASAKSKKCSHPNGDVEYWWDSASAAEKQCFIDEYGEPSF